MLPEYHTIPTFNDPQTESLLKTLWEKEKMLVTSIFSFSLNVFYPSPPPPPQKKKVLCLSHIYFLSAKFFNLDHSKNLSFGSKELKSYFRIVAVQDITECRSKIRMGVMGELTSKELKHLVNNPCY